MLLEVMATPLAPSPSAALASPALQLPAPSPLVAAGQLNTGEHFLHSFLVAAVLSPCRCVYIFPC